MQVSLVALNCLSARGHRKSDNFRDEVIYTVCREISKPRELRRATVNLTATAWSMWRFKCSSLDRENTRDKLGAWRLMLNAKERVATIRAKKSSAHAFFLITPTPPAAKPTRISANKNNYSCSDVSCLREQMILVRERINKCRGDWTFWQNMAVENDSFIYCFWLFSSEFVIV